MTTFTDTHGRTWEDVTVNGYTFTGRQRAAQHRKCCQAIARQAKRHTVEFNPETERLEVYEPADAGGLVACVLTGHHDHPATLEQAFAIASALDRLMKRKGAALHKGDHP